MSRTQWTWNMTTVIRSFGKLNKPLLKSFLWGVGFTERYFPMDYNTTKISKLEWYHPGIRSVSCHQDTALWTSIEGPVQYL